MFYTLVIKLRFSRGINHSGDISNFIANRHSNWCNFNFKFCSINISRLVGKPTMWFPNRSDTNDLYKHRKELES